MNTRALTLPVLVSLSLAAPGVAAAQRSAPRPSLTSGRVAAAMSDSAQVFLTAALDSLQATSRHGAAVPWPRIRDSAFALAAGAQAITDTYGALNWALKRVDLHSFLSARITGANARLLDGRTGYLWVRSYNGPAQAPLADSLQATLRRLEAQGACGWIVDLRNNGGGNVWPMLAGVGPLLGDSVAGISTTLGGAYRLIYAGGVAAQAGPGAAYQVFTRLTSPLVLRAPLAPVAVLINGATGSSGANIAIAFRGRPHTRFFGEPSATTTTVNRGVTLPNGAEMVVTTGVMGDRTGRLYGAAIEPDETIVMPESHWPSPVDPVATRAAVWLASLNACPAR
jgi:carboxyl-terminal processing protease